MLIYDIHQYIHTPQCLWDTVATLISNDEARLNTPQDYPKDNCCEHVFLLTLIKIISRCIHTICKTYEWLTFSIVAYIAPSRPHLPSCSCLQQTIFNRLRYKLYV